MMRRKKPQGKVDGSWLTTYADMVTLMLCFFVILFAMSDVNEEQFTALAEALGGRILFAQGALGRIFSDGAGVLPDQSPPIDQRQELDPNDPIVEDLEVRQAAQAMVEQRDQLQGMAETFRTYLAPTDIAEMVTVEVQPPGHPLGEHLVITFEDGMLFDSGRATLRPEAVEVIDYIASVLQDYPGHQIRIQGHTDSIPINTVAFPSNRHLSAARAIAVEERLVDIHGFPPTSVTAEGKGEFHPIDTNETVEGRARNRRVEILLFARQASAEEVPLGAGG